MTFKTLDFKCALVTGGGGGIGRGIAEYFLKSGKEVIICGRTESNLQQTAKELNNDKLSYYVLDTGDVKAIPAFVRKITTEHPDIDCLVNNAGVQRPLEVDKMDADEFLSKADQEIDIDIRGPMHLALHFLPHFRSKDGAVIMNVSSLLAFFPMSIINPVYNGSKAWLHFWSMNLRTQLEHSGSNVRVIEIAPPTVSTDLHREREDPSDNSKEKNSAALSVDEFMSEVIEKWKKDEDTIGAGPANQYVDKWFDAYGKEYEKVAAK